MLCNAGRAAGAIALIAVVFAPLQADAAASYGATVGVGNSDNIARTSENEQEETIATAGLDLTLSRSGSRLDAELASQLQYLDYQNDTFDSEVVGSVVGLASLQIIEERFIWMAEDTFGQTVLDQFSPVTPGNRENVNYLTTGPDIIVPLTSHLDVRLEGRYSDVHYEDSDLGSDRLLGRTALEHRFSEASSVSLNGEFEQVEYDDADAFEEYDREEAFVRYELSGARTSMGVELGSTTIKLADDSADGPLARLRLSRSISSSSTLSFDGGYEYSDAGDVFRQLQQSAPRTAATTQPVQRTANPFRNTYGTLRWNFEGNRTGFGANLGAFDEDYEVQSQFDRRRIEYGLSAHRELSRAVSIGVSGRYSDEDYQSLDRQFAETSGEASLLWRIGRMSYITLQYMYWDRSDDLETGEYTENQVWLRFGVSGGGSDEAELQHFGSLQ